MTTRRRAAIEAATLVAALAGMGLLLLAAWPAR